MKNTKPHNSYGRYFIGIYKSFRPLKFGHLFYVLGPSFVSLFTVFISIYFIYTQSHSNILAKPIDLPKNLIFIDEPDYPSRILIPKLSVDVSVRKAEIKDGTWQTFEHEASYGIGSSFLNKPGNTVIFAHARAGLFSRLDELKESDAIYVLSKDDWYKYEVFTKLYVDPHEISFLNTDYEKSLILFTCYGPEDKKRVVVISKFKGGNGVFETN